MASHTLKLRDLLQKDRTGMQPALQLIAQGNVILDCTDVVTLEPAQLDLIFSDAPQHWDLADFWPLINVDTLTDTLAYQLEQWINQRKAQVPKQQVTQTTVHSDKTDKPSSKEQDKRSYNPSGQKASFYQAGENQSKTRGKKPENFIVVDTEGKDSLREIAIVNATGNLVYEAFAQEYSDNNARPFNVKPLKQILQDFFKLAESSWVIFHSATHDVQVIRNSCYHAKVSYSKINTICTVELARQHFPSLPSYSLEYLSKKFSLKVDNQFFISDQAHTARYDALFTYQLYQKFQQPQSIVKPMISTNHKSNPFSSICVDNPFQDHIDFRDIHQSEFEQLKYLIDDIRHDKNNQSQGVVVIGDPGSGKTHLMMRLAKELLRVNRLLFIRHPNNSYAVLHHIYSRILESFVYEIPGTNHTQLDFLLAHSFVKLISHTPHITLTQKDQDIQAAVKTNPLELYEKLGSEGTQKKRAYWDHIEKRTHDWWTMKYGIGGYAPEIIKGIIKFCSYSKPHLKAIVARWLAGGQLMEEDLEAVGLSNWGEDISKETFSLEAISVFSKLSLLDEPLIIVFDQLEILGLKQNEELLLNFGEAVKEIFTHVPNSLIILNLFPDRWQQFQQKLDPSVVHRISQNQLSLKRPENQVLREILSLRVEGIGEDLNQIFSPSEIETILSHRTIREVLMSASKFYSHKAYGRPLSEEISSVVTNTDYRTIEDRLDKLEQDFQDFRLLFQKIGQAFGVISSDFPITTKEIEERNEKRDINTASSSIFIPEEESRIQRYLTEKRQQLEENYDKLQIISDSDDMGKLKIILEAIQPLHFFTLDHLQIKSKIPENLIINTENNAHVIAFLNEAGNAFTLRIKNFNKLVVSHKGKKFLLWRDKRESNIRPGTVGMAEIEKLNNSKNGEFRLMEKDDRINLELLSSLITDIYSRDLDVNLEEAWPLVTQFLPDCWLLKILSH